MGSERAFGEGFDTLSRSPESQTVARDEIIPEVEVVKFGTLAKFSAKPGKEQDLLKVFSEIEANPSPGFLYSTAFRSVDRPGEFWVSVVYESEDAYRQNASSPDSNQRYQRMVELLEGAPEWHDGHVTAEAMRKPADS